jgi:molecular chaperone GrpE
MSDGKPTDEDVEPKPEVEASVVEAPTAEAPKEDFYGQLLRLKAEFENFRKRTDREKPEYYKAGKADMLLKLLPVYDVLRKAHADIQASHGDSAAAKGMDMVFKEFEKIFKEEGVTIMEPVGKPYDASKHEVLGMAAKDGAADGEVVDVLQDGYMQGDRVLRTAKVRIAKQS